MTRFKPNRQENRTKDENSIYAFTSAALRRITLEQTQKSLAKLQKLENKVGFTRNY